MTTIANLVVELDAWCASYVEAFEAFDVVGIGFHWAFPALIVSGARSLAALDPVSFDRNTKALVDFYERQNARRVERKVLSAAPMGPDTAAMQVADTMMTPEGEPITDWVSAYVLRRTAAGWRAIFADATGEVTAWAARGTPLGGG